MIGFVAGVGGGVKWGGGSCIDIIIPTPFIFLIIFFFDFIDVY